MATPLSKANPNWKGTTLSVLGWLLTGLGVVFFVLGVWLGWREFLAAALFMVAAVAVALLFTVGRSSYQVRLELAQNRIKVGQRAFGQVEISNTGRANLLPARIELPVGRSRAEFSLPGLRPKQVHEEMFTIPSKRRAVIAVGPVSSVRSDPLGIARRELVWTGSQELFVHPEIIQLGSKAAGFMRDLEGQTRNTVTDNDMDFHALREYVPGDDRRQIHWKSSARNQNLMVRQFEDTRRTFTALALESSSSAWASPAEYELGISIVASLGIQVLREGMELAVFSGTQPLRVLTPRTLLDDTCRLTLEPAGAQYVSGPQTITRNCPEASLAIVVTGSLTSRAVLRSMSRVLSPNVRTLFISCVPGQKVRAQRVGQITLASVGALDDLPQLLRKAAVT